MLQLLQRKLHSKRACGNFSSMLARRIRAAAAGFVHALTPFVHALTPFVQRLQASCSG